jgi:hypothetical protein
MALSPHQPFVLGKSLSHENLRNSRRQHASVKGYAGRQTGRIDMKTFLLLCFLLVGSALLPQRSYADTGQIHAYDANVREISQKAVILHNGSEEILILGTDLQADRKVGLLRFIPFPAEPQVSLAPPDVFESMAALLAKHQLQFLVASKSGPMEGQAVELRLQQKLGVHDLTIIKVNDPLQFRSWVNDYFTTKNLPVKPEYPLAEGIVEDYVQRGIRYFVLDFVEISEDPRLIEPVLYRFASKDLYYPLKTSNTFGGTGGIDLMLILTGSLCRPSLAANDTCLGFPAGPMHGQMHASTSAALSAEEILPLYPEAGEFFGGKPVFLQMVSYWGDYIFDRDIFADVGEAIPQAHGYEAEQNESFSIFSTGHTP